MKPVKCTYSDCDASFVSHNKLISHLRNQHKNAFSCDCGASFQCASLLNAHRDEFHDDTKAACPICSKFIVKNNIWKHIHRYHSESSIVCCDRTDCQEMFISPRKLYKHKLEKHYPPNLICSYCGLRFDTISSYDEHYQPNHATLAEKMTFSRDPSKRWGYKLYFIRSINGESFKVGITSCPLRNRLSQYVTYQHVIVDWWPLPDQHCYAHQIENKIHLTIARAGFQLIEPKREYFKLHEHVDDEVQHVWNLIMSQSIFTEPLRLAPNSSSNKLYFFYNKNFELGKVGYTTMTIYERLHSINKGQFTLISGCSFHCVHVIHVDQIATIHELKAWENDIIVRLHEHFEFITDEHFYCPNNSVELATKVFCM
jgi:hypothetical protein